MTDLNSGSSGMALVSLLFLFTFFSVGVFGQPRIKPNWDLLPNHSYTSASANSGPVTGKLKILGVMVEFAPDTNRFTSGNGTFGPESIPYLKNPGTNIDALPHDKNYFESHLEFSKNYFETVSRNKISIDFEVLPEIYKLSQPMAYYSPTGENPDLSVMAGLVNDVWTLVGESGNIPTDFRQGENIAFVIFHAGVGRDIELTGTNLDKTPQDLPSFYLSKNTLSDFLNDQSFSGFPIDSGNLLVNNTLIIPRTLTRAGEDATGNRFLLPLSINGLLAAQIGSHLGLPDLFNTQTGEPGIGRFGLMDGASIFSYNGLFPPEPSAWEKMFLGWTSPFRIDYDAEGSVSVPAVSLRQDRSIAKVPISTDEYFLVENRHRDPDGTGVTITIKKNDGTYVEQVFTNEDVLFTNQQSGFDKLLEPGVVVNVSNYDFSLPGGRISDPGSENSEQLLNGGILIWHIDEALIREKIGQGGINSNKDRRGVDLEEADGAQDIGRPASIGFSRNEVNGSPFDFWWAGNTAGVITQTDTLRFYKNRFAPETTPDNHSNSGALSYFELYDFSENLPVANFKIRPVQPATNLYDLWDSKSNLSITTASDPADAYWKRYPLAAQSFQINQDEWILLPGINDIQFYHPEDKTVIASSISLPSIQQPFISEKNGELALAQNPLDTGNQLTVSTYQFDGKNLTRESAFEVQPNRGFISSFEENILDIDGTSYRIDIASNEVIQTEAGIQFSERAGEYQSKIAEGTLILNFPGGSESFLLNSQNKTERCYTGLIRSQPDKIYFYLLEDDQFSLFSPDDHYQTKNSIYKSGFIDWPAIADFDENGHPDILFVDYSSNRLIAKNINGAFLPSFPISPPQDIHFTGTPLIADLDGDDRNEIIITGYDSYSMNLLAYHDNGEQVDGFPLYVGGIKDIDTQPVHPLLAGNKLIALSHSGDLKVWKFEHLQNIQWKSKYGNGTSNKISGSIESDQPPGQPLSLLNEKETYNWPNPAVDETQIRYQTREPAEIYIKILAVSGRVIGEKTLQSRGGVAEEFTLDTSDWASGAYLALVEATANGVTERKLLKIAIAR